MSLFKLFVKFKKKLLIVNPISSYLAVFVIIARELHVSMIVIMMITLQGYFSASLANGNPSLLEEVP